MLRTFLAMAAATALLLPIGTQAQPADFIVTNAKIATLDAASTTAQALAVREGRVVAVGGAGEMRAFSGPGTRTVDAGGRTVIPGLIDSHMHAVRAALSYSTEVNWIGAGTIAEAMARIRTAASRARPGGWLIVAGGWNEQQFAERRRPTMAELQEAAPEHPVYVQLFYEAVVMTPKALEALGVAAGALPAGMKPAADGAPGWMTGDIVGISALFDKLPKPTYADNVAGTRAFFSELNRLGITGLVDPGGFSIAPSQYAALFELWREKALTLRVAYSVFAQKPGAELQEFRELTQMLPMGFGDDMLKFNGLGERVTLAMYNNNFPDAAAKEKFYELIKWAALRKLAVTIHWQENGSVDHLLGQYEKLNAEVPIKDLRWSIAHLDDASPETLARMKALGIGWTMQDAMYFQGDRALTVRGEAARRMPPIGSALRAGVNVGAGTDAHRVASYNPFVALQWMLDGKTVSDKPMRGADETPTREQALRLYTAGSAWFSFDEAKRGTLEVGKLADFAILDQDFFAVPVERIGRTVSLMTVVGGRVVYAARPFDAAGTSVAVAP
ncbi:amidohydrolase [Variovorax sp. AFSI2.2]|uniref:amidohydrolase n=1 Tax=Variovorax sp. AFSI2.2 TaxID=3384160 RepID=UPI003EBF66EF